MKIHKNIFCLVIIFAPFFTHAQGLEDLILSSRGIIDTLLIPLGYAVCLLYFAWGIVKYIRSIGDKEEGKSIMTWGVVGLFVVTSIWGIITVIRSEFQIGDKSTLDTFKYK